MMGLKCRKTNIKRVAGERLGRKVSVWMSKIGAEHFTYPENHDHRGFRHLQGRKISPTITQSKGIYVRTFWK